MAENSRKRSNGSSPPGWCQISQAANYAGVKPRTIREWMKMGLKYAQINAKLKLTKFEYIDDFLNGFHPDGGPSVEAMTEQAFRNVMGQN